MILQSPSKYSKERSCSKRLSQRHTWLTAPSCLTSCFFCFRICWSHDLSWSSVKDMTLVHLSWDLFPHLLCHLHFLDSLKDTSDMKLRKCPFLPSRSNYHPSSTYSNLLALSYFISHQWVRIWFSTNSCYCAPKSTSLHAPQHPLEDLLSSPSLLSFISNHVCEPPQI